MLEYLGWNNLYGASIANVSALSADSRSRETRDDVQRLEKRLGMIELGIETLIRLGVQKGHFSEQEFIEMARKVDAEDGVLDGRRDLHKLRRQCPKCSKISPADNNTCYWCGTDISGMRPALIELPL